MSAPPARPRPDRPRAAPALPFPETGRTLYATAEFLNPSGSIKDRLALAIIEDAEERGHLRPDSIILACTSGNTGISLVMVGAAKGCRVKILMSASASVERRHLIRHLGGEVQRFAANRGYATGIDLSRELAARAPRIFLPRQFENPRNALDYELATGPAILAQLGGPADAFVSGYGTGGTLTGFGRALRSARAATRVLVMEPTEASLLCGEMPCRHLIEGVAGGYVPPRLRDAKLDGVVKVSSADALAMTRRLSREFGLLIGTSSGANITAALRTAGELPPAAKVVTILCDRAERYGSTKLFADSSNPEPRKRSW